MAAILEIQFTGIGIEDENIDVTGGGIIETFKPTRSTNKRVNIASDAILQATEFRRAFISDYNFSPVYQVTQDEDSVFVEHPDNDHFNARTATATNITFVLTTTPQVATITVAEDYTTNILSPCGTVTMNLTFTVSGGGTVEGLRIARTFGNSFGLEAVLYEDVAHNSNTLSLIVNREEHINTTAKATISGNDTFFTINTVRKTLVITTVITPGFFDATVKVNINSFLGSAESTYAIAQPGAAIVFQNSNIFSAVLPGDYFVFAKDKYGCQKSEFITVVESQNLVDDPIMFFSKKNSHYFAERKTTNLANPDSALSYDDPYPVTADGFKQIWSSNQITTDQFQSGFVRHEAKLIVCDGITKDLEFALTIEQMTDNINQDNYLEALINEDVVNGYARIRFVPGDVYDPEGVVIGQHQYDNDLPPYYELGTKLRIEGFETEITEIRSVVQGSETIQYAYTNLPSFGSEQSFIVQSIHQEMDYEDFHIRLPHTDLLDKEYQIEISAYSNATTTTPSKTFLSEVSRVITKDELDEANYHQCEFFSYGHDREINYKQWDYTDINNRIPTTTEPYRISHFRNLEFYKPLEPIVNAEVETEKLGSLEVKLDYLTREAYKTRLKELPSLYAASIAKASNETQYIKIDGVVYTTLSSADLDGDNQYKTPSVTLVKVGGSNEFEQIVKNAREFYPVNRD